LFRAFVRATGERCGPPSLAGARPTGVRCTKS